MTCEEFEKITSTTHPKDMPQKQAIEICLHMDGCEKCRTMIMVNAIIADLMGFTLSQEEADAVIEAGTNAAKAYFQGGVN